MGLEMSPKQKIQQKNKKRGRLWLFILISVALLAIVVVALEFTDVTHFFHAKSPTPHTSSPYTKGEPKQQPDKTGGNAADQRDGDTYTNTKGQSDTPVNPEATLEPPTGTFVSAHKISLNTNPPLQSTCETTPKASCYITFTNGSKVVKLNQQTTDDGGAAYWTWKPKDVGLTTGSWKVQAVAQLGSKTLTADDSLKLEITP